MGEQMKRIYDKIDLSGIDELAIYGSRVRHTDNFGDYIITKELFNTGMPCRMFEIQFLDTGYTTVVQHKHINCTTLKDKLKPFVCGVGYYGYLDKKTRDPEVKLVYGSWNSMLRRCYDANYKEYKSYGGAGITVDPSWYNFTQFFYDVQQLPNFDKKLMYPDMYALDKDYLQMNIPTNMKVYSKNTCIWLSKLDNTLISAASKGKSGYFGVEVISECKFAVYCNGKIYGYFTDVIAAANYYNYVFSISRVQFNDIELLNNVPYMPLEEVMKYSTKFSR